MWRCWFEEPGFVTCFCAGMSCRYFTQRHFRGASFDVLKSLPSVVCNDVQYILASATMSDLMETEVLSLLGLSRNRFAVVEAPVEFQHISVDVKRCANYAAAEKTIVAMAQDHVTAWRAGRDNAARLPMLIRAHTASECIKVAAAINKEVCASLCAVVVWWMRGCARDAVRRQEMSSQCAVASHAPGGTFSGCRNVLDAWRCHNVGDRTSDSPHWFQVR